MEVQVLGPLRVSLAGVEVELGGERQQRVLLALILARGDVVSTEHLIDLVWGAHPPAKPNVTLRTYVSHLRKALEPRGDAGDRRRVIVTRRPGYAFDPAAADIDLYRFEAAARLALSVHDDDPALRLAATRAALEHWPLDGGPSGLRAITAIAEFEADATAVADLHRALLLHHHRALLDAGHHDEAVAPLERASEADPYDEDLLALRITALARAGRAPAALDAADRFRRRLVEELGLDPTPRLRDLEQRILDQDPDLVPPAAVPPTAAPATTPAPPGRSAVLDRLHEALPADGSGSLACLVGPAGIGKTTVADALADAARRRGVTVAWGRNLDRDRPATLHTWRAVLRDLAEQVDETTAMQHFEPHASELAHLMPEIARRLGIEPVEIERGDLVDAVVRTLRSWAADRPLLLVLEDLHWADADSILVARALADATTTSPITVLATWRDTDVAAEAATGRSRRTTALADLARASDDLRIALDGLDTAAGAELVAALRPDEPLADELLERLVAHTGGNPLYLTELVRQNDSTAPISATDTIRDAVLRRLDPIERPSARILTRAAAAHPDLTDELMVDLVGAGADAVDEAIEVGLASRLLEEHLDRPGHYRFAHDLVAETLYGEVRAPARIELHRRIAAHLERTGGSPFDISHHYLLAGRDHAVEAAQWAHRAGNEAARLGDHDTAIELFDRAVDLLVPRGPAAELADLCIDRAQTLKHLRRPVDAQRAAAHAVDVALEVDDVELAVVAAMVYCGEARIDRTAPAPHWLGYWSPPDRSAHLLERCLAVLPDDSPHEGMLTLALSGQLFGPDADPARSEDLGRRGIELMRSGDPAFFAHGLVAAVNALTRRFSPAEQETLIAEALQLAVDTEQPMAELNARRFRITQALDRRDPVAARHELTMALDRAEQWGEPLLRMHAGSFAVAMDLLVGDFDQASDRIGAAFAEFADHGAAALDLYGMLFFQLSRQRGDLDPVIGALQERLAGYPGPAYGAPLASVLAQLGRLDEAAEVLARFRVEDLTSHGEGVLQFTTAGFAAEAAVRLGDRALASALADALAPARGRLLCMLGGHCWFAPGSLHLGRLATLLDDPAASAHLDDARDHAAAIGARPFLVEIELAAADLAQRNGDVAAASKHRAAAADGADELGMTWMLADPSA